MREDCLSSNVPPRKMERLPASMRIVTAGNFSLGRRSTVAQSSTVHSRGWVWLLRVLITGVVAGAVALAVGKKSAPLAAPPAIATIKPAASVPDTPLPPAAESDARIGDALAGLTARPFIPGSRRIMPSMAGW